MIRHKQIITKTDTSTLTLAEMGDIVANKATELSITIPNASGHKGLWYYILNIGIGACEIIENSIKLVTLQQGDSAYLICDGTNWHIGESSSYIPTTYTHNQTVPLDIWTINHNLGRYPSVSIVDSAGTEVKGKIDYIDENNITVSFSSGFSGKAHLN